MPDPTILIATALITLAVMTAIWFVSLKLADVSIVDIYWGPGFGVIMLTALALADGASDGDRIIAALTLLWGLRLGIYLFLRWRSHTAEDSRYRAMRRASKGDFAYRSYVGVFLLQSAIMWFVSLPLQFAAMSADDADWRALPLAGTALFAIGLSFESIADWQLSRFKRDPANNGRVMDRGLWAWTRHPNYFGDVCVWWGLWLLCLAGGAPIVTIVSPLAMTWLLVRVSGASLLERGLKRTKLGYAAYITRTSGFVPWPPGRRTP